MSFSSWPQRMESLLGRLAAAGHRRPLAALALAAVLTGAAALSARHLTLNADLVELLPPSFQSVKDIDKLRVRFGGMGYVVVAGLEAEPEVLKRFAEDMAPRLATLPEARYVDYKRSTGFFEERALYYLETEDLRTVQQRIDDRIAYERRSRNPLFIQLDDEGPPSLDFADIEKKYSGSSNQRLAGSGELYYLDPEQRMIVLLLKPKGNSADLGYAKQLIGTVEDFLARQDMSAYPGLKTAITGTYKKKVDQQKEITQDLARASVLALVLLVAYLAYHFRSLLSVIFTLTPVFAGLLWTYGFVGVAYGQVNLLTGFLGAILGGLGVEHGIHLLGRYRTLRTEGMDSAGAVREAFAHTGFSSLVAAGVAALTFLSLAQSEFRAFREFGVIAAVGMLVSVAAYVLVLPALLGLATRLGLAPRPMRETGGVPARLGHWLPRRHRLVALATGLVLAFLIFWAPKVRFNYDFAALDDVTLPSVQLDKKIDRILGYSQTPVVVLTDSPQMEREVVKELLARKKAQGDKSTIDFVAALDDLVPQAQEEKHGILQQMHRQLQRIKPEGLEPDARAQLERAVTMTQATPFTRADLPEAIRRQFESPEGHTSGFVLVFASVPLSDGAAVRRYAREVRELQLSDGSKVSAAGEAFVLADILEMVTEEAPRVLVVAVLSVLVAMWVSLGRLRTALVCMLPTLLSILALVGLMALFDMPFNYLNIVVVPVLIGTTVDAGVHLVSRLSQAHGDFPAVYAETGRAILGGLLTSAVGFGALVLAHHPGLNSIGALANLGFGVNLVVVLLGFPALLLLLRKGWTEVPAEEAAAPEEPAPADAPPHTAPGGERTDAAGSR